MLFSIIVPVYKCRDSLQELCDRLVASVGPIASDLEIILVDDGCPQGSWEEIQRLASSESRVKGIRLARNFGQHKAISAGLDAAEGEWIVVMDGDLQDRPEEIPRFHEAALAGDYDVVFGRRRDRRDGMFKRFGSYAFYRLFDYLAETKTDNTVGNFSLISARVLHSLRGITEQNRAYPLFVKWMGYSTGFVDIKHDARAHGETSYTFRRKLDLAIDIIVSQSNRPLRMSIKLGFVLALLSVLYSVKLLVQYFFFEIAVAGWTSLMVSLYFLTGLIFANLGFMGLYVGKIFDEVKGRPVYLVAETTSGKDNP